MSSGVGEFQIMAGVMRLSGDYTHATVARHLVTAEAAEIERVDLSELGQVDSSTLGLLLTLKRRAIARQKPLDIVGWPEGLIALARLYGVRDLF